MANIAHDMWRRNTRTIRQNQALGELFFPDNGLGQGDIFSLLPAFGLVSWQFYALDEVAPEVEKGAYIDDRNFRGRLTSLMRVHDFVCGFDEGAGHRLQHEKTAFVSTSKEVLKKLGQTVLNGHVPRHGNLFTFVGEPITSALYRIAAPANERINKALTIANRLCAIPANLNRKARVAAAIVLPTATYGTQWLVASCRKQGQLTSRMLHAV